MTQLNPILANLTASLRATVSKMEFVMTAIVKMKTYWTTSVQVVIARLAQNVCLALASTITALYLVQILAFAQKIKLKDVVSVLALNALGENSASISGACLIPQILWPQKHVQTVSVTLTGTVPSLRHQYAQEYFVMEMINASQRDASIIFALSLALI